MCDMGFDVKGEESGNKQQRLNRELHLLSSDDQIHPSLGPGVCGRFLLTKSEPSLCIRSCNSCPLGKTCCIKPYRCPLSDSRTFARQSAQPANRYTAEKAAWPRPIIWHRFLNQTQLLSPRISIIKMRSRITPQLWCKRAL